MTSQFQYRISLAIDNRYKVTVTPVKTDKHQTTKVFYATGKRAIDSLVTNIVKKLGKNPFPPVAVLHPETGEITIAMDPDTLHNCITGGFQELEKTR